MAFSYYSRVIQEFQSHRDNVVVVYMHTKHEHCHHSNTDQLSKIAQRHTAFGCVFRRLGWIAEDIALDLKVAAEGKSVELYPFFTIDLETSGRPVHKGMIQDNLEVILKKAASTHATTLDISEENLGQVFAINHPDEDNHRQRQKARTKTQADLDQQQNTGSSEEVNSAPKLLAVETVEDAGAVVELWTPRPKTERTNCCIFFGSVQYKDDVEDDE